MTAVPPRREELMRCVEDYGITQVQASRRFGHGQRLVVVREGPVSDDRCTILSSFFCAFEAMSKERALLVKHDLHELLLGLVEGPLYGTAVEGQDSNRRVLRVPQLPDALYCRPNPQNVVQLNIQVRGDRPMILPIPLARSDVVDSATQLIQNAEVLQGLAFAEGVHDLHLQVVPLLHLAACALHAALTLIQVCPETPKHERRNEQHENQRPSRTAKDGYCKVEGLERDLIVIRQQALHEEVRRRRKGRNDPRNEEQVRNGQEEESLVEPYLGRPLLDDG
mmetsp:Transcript_9238/g.24280  ORF Transcript_9238/g.24280 Transcript_9238/m.24280 type:complete len:280 (+) Transcript_9238:701-1540(+)